MKKVLVSQPIIGEDEKNYVMDALAKGQISGFSGEYIGRFEEEFAKFCGAGYGVAVSNGTVALHLALAALKIGPGDEVLVQSFTNMATFFAVLYQGARPIPIDSESGTWNIDPALIEKQITPKTKAIMVVHIFGHPVDMDPVMDIAKRHNLYVIEDCAEAHGAEYKGKKVGSIGDIGCFSFYANKIITTGEGGMLTMNNKDLSDRARMLKSLAFGSSNKFMHQDVGYNYRMTNYQAAFGVAQMKHIESTIEKKRELAAYYLDAFKDEKRLLLPVERPYAKNVYWMFHVTLQGAAEGKRKELFQKLEEAGIEVREAFIPFNGQEIFIQKGLTKKEDCPVANHVGENGFYIPSGPILSEEDRKYVVDEVRKALDVVSG